MRYFAALSESPTWSGTSGRDLRCDTCNGFFWSGTLNAKRRLAHLQKWSVSWPKNAVQLKNSLLPVAPRLHKVVNTACLKPACAGPRERFCPIDNGKVETKVIAHNEKACWRLVCAQGDRRPATVGVYSVLETVLRPVDGLDAGLAGNNSSGYESAVRAAVTEAISTRQLRSATHIKTVYFVRASESGFALLVSVDDPLMSYGRILNQLRLWRFYKVNRRSHQLANQFFAGGFDRGT
jgi:hypothetical protein